MAAPSIIEVPYDAADQFLARLSPVDPSWEDVGGLHDWVFRGQRDAAWGLNPAAMREDVLFSKERPIEEIPEQLMHEEKAVMEFVHMCIRAGIPLPEDSQWLRSSELRSQVFDTKWQTLYDKGARFPPPLYRSFYALAQHYGVPTRLLDWTQSPLVAAYFACKELAEALALRGAPPEDQESDCLAVWALRCSVFWVRSEIANFNPFVSRVDAPHGENPNLRAQRGLFTLVQYKNLQQKWILPTIEEAILEWTRARYGSEDSEHDYGPLLLKLTLPLAKSRRLLRLLDQMNVNAATVFPSYNGAVRAIAEREYWP